MASGQLAGQIALVTGATRGLGRAIALELAARGATVIGTATTDEGAAKIAAYLKDAGTGLTLDVTDAAATASVLAAIDAQYGAITILVNNAGVTRDNLLLRMKDDEWDTIMATNLTPAYRLAKAVLRGMMKARHGRIIQIGSVVGSSGNAGQVNYSAAKAGDIGFTKALALENAKGGITVNVICPGYINTEMVQAVPKDVLEKAILPLIPTGRLGEPEEIARAVVFLAADEAGAITGSTLSINGGQYMI